MATKAKAPVDTPVIPADLRARLEAVAADLGLSFDALVEAALRQFISDLDRGRRPG